MMKCMNIGRRPYTFEAVQGLRPIHLTGCPLAPPNYAALRKGGASTSYESPTHFARSLILTQFCCVMAENLIGLMGAM